MNGKQRGFSLIELVIVVAIIGVLVAIALPQYQNYQIRSKVTEALVMGASVQRAVVSYYNSKGVWPLGNLEAGLPADVELSSTYIKKIRVGDTDCGHIKIKFQNDPKLGALKKRWLWMRPVVSTDGGSIEWSCAVNRFNETKHLVPKECRNKPNGAFKSCP
jgi:type IV pilus assembly protein PilA